MKTIINKYGLWGMKNIDAKKVFGNDIIIITNNNFLHDNFDFGTEKFESEFCTFGMREHAKEIIDNHEKEFLGKTIISLNGCDTTIILLFGENKGQEIAPIFENAKSKLKDLYNAKIFTFSFQKNGKEIFESEFILGLSNTKEQAKAMKKQFS